MNSKERRIPSREIVVLAGLLVLALAVRLIKISQPYVDEWSFKQGTIAMIAENFYRNGFNIFYPQINWAGNAAGYIGTEFPLVPFLASLLYVPFGVQEWIGRSVSVTFSVLALPFFYFLVKKVSNERSAVFAGVIYAVAPLSIFASRSFMSDMTSLGFSIAALYLFSEWLDRSNNWRLCWRRLHNHFGDSRQSACGNHRFAAGIHGLGTVSMANHLPAENLGVCRSVSGFSGRLVFPCIFLTMTYPPHQFIGSDGLWLEDLHFYTSVGRRLVGSSLTPVVAVGTLAGLFLPLPRPNTGECFIGGSLLFAFLSSSLASEIVILGINFPSCLWRRPSPGGRLIFCCTECARSLQSRSAELFGGTVLFLTLFAVSYVYVRPLYEPWAAPLRKAGDQLNRMTSPDALAVFVVDGDSSGIYYSRRKGWHAFDDSDWGAPLDSAQAIMELEKLRNRGATHLVFTLYTVWWLDYYNEFADYLDSYYRRVSETEDYVIFDLADGLNKTATAGGSPSFRVDPSQD